MARPYPTDAEILEIRPDLLDYLSSESDLQAEAVRAIKQVKIDLEDQRGVLWSRVFDADTGLYLTSSDGLTRNDEKIPRMIAIYVVYMVFRDYAINMGGESQWFVVANEFLVDYEKLMLHGKLDIDYDDSGAITEDEDAETGQTFMRR